ncbi:hypothetical protein CTAM01_10331 [Colletotrichum tamarilloi]|uniref:Uncharacterized protein n=1 Tax=Colletotrichum tamarilloi TaxID=1209934 RepID=A0ABQ9R0T9_9PEZI|nr:uncharacterized protein CTAM01_10331 [Colletotrichum tamarilloi]KAK1491216.1 hypothetical protein CTAM01_10331 [Colletotrichum tamarilloi]
MDITCSSVRFVFFGILGILTSAYAEHLRVVWSSGAYGAIGDPSGSGTNGGYTGFAIINDAGEAVYVQAYPNDHSPYLGGAPNTCKVKDSNGNVLGSGTHIAKG